MDETMDTDVTENQPLTTPAEQINEQTEGEELPSTDMPPEEEEMIPMPAMEVFDWNTSLVSQFCREGDIDRLRMFVEYSQQMSACCAHASAVADHLEMETGLSPLHHAARYQRLEICVMLISNLDFVYGPNIKDSDGRTPVHSVFRSSTAPANSQGQLRMDTDFGNKMQDYFLWQEEYQEKILTSDHPLIYLFAKAKGDMNACDKYLLTPLHYAVARNNLAGVKQLIALGAQIEAKDRQGIRPLHIACREGYVDVVDYLLEHNAEIDALDADDWTPVHHTCSRGHLELLQLIQSKKADNFRALLRKPTNTNATCIHLAVQSGNVDLVKYILSNFTDDVLPRLLNEQEEPLGTSLHVAAKFCDPSMINLLFQRGADPLTVNTNGQSALHVASASNRLAIVQELVKLAPTSLLEIQDMHGRTALSVASHSDIADQLVTFGADISSQDHNQMNALMIAVANRRLAVVDRLLAVVSERSTAVLDQVEKSNDRSIFLIAVETGYVEMCSLLLSYPSVRWDTIDRHRVNAFHIAARNNHYELIQLLCNHITDQPDPSLSSSSNLGSYLDAQNEDGKTPLHFAAENGHTQSVEVLLKNGADALVTSYLGQLPLHGAVQNGHSSTVDMLLQACTQSSADFRAILARRQSPLISACQHGYADVVKLLLDHQIGIDHGMSFDDPEEEENALEIAIKHQENETVHTLLEHPHTEYWLMPVRKTRKNEHQTPLREMIQRMPDCAEHALDKFIVKSTETHFSGETFERTVYLYKFIDDYYTSDGKLYTRLNHRLYRNHPFIIALDNEEHSSSSHSLLDHPLATQLMSRKWKLYRPIFYFPRILSFLLLFILTGYVLLTPAPLMGKTTVKSTESSLFTQMLTLARWSIVFLSTINLSIIFFEIVLYRGLRVPFAQLLGTVSFAVSIIAFLPYDNKSDGLLSRQWQLTSFAILFQWFNAAVILRSVPFFGKFIVMLESVLVDFVKLLSVMLPLLVAFTIPTLMSFFTQPSLSTFFDAIQKSSAMLVGELDYETMFFAKQVSAVAVVIFTPFLAIMTIVFMNLLLGITIGDIQGSMAKARAKANAYWIRELIFIETILPNERWFKSNIIERETETIEYGLRDPVNPSATASDDTENSEESSVQQLYATELKKSLEILDTLCNQAKQALEYETNLEGTLKQLLAKVLQSKSNIHLD